MQFLSSTAQQSSIPPAVSHFKTLVSELKESGNPEESMKYYLKSIAKNAENYPEEYKIKSNVSTIIKKIEPQLNNFFKNLDKTKLLFDFLSSALNNYKSSKETTKIFFKITMKTAELDNTEILQLSSQYIITLLGNEVIFSYMFTQSRLAELFQNCFCLYPNTRLFYGPLILSEISNRVFTKITNLTEFMDKAKTLLHDGNIEPKSSVYALTFIGYAIRSIDTGDFLPEILPYIVELAPLCEDLSFYYLFLQAPTSQPTAAWRSLKDITNDENMTVDLMNTILLAIEQSLKFPPSPEDFSFRPYIPIFDQLSKDHQNLLYTFLIHSPPSVVIDFIQGTIPLSKTKFDLTFLSSLCEFYQFKDYLPDLWSSFIVNQDLDEFINGDEKMLIIASKMLDKMTDTYRPDAKIMEVFLKLALSKWNDMITCIIDRFLINLNVRSYMPIIVSYLKNELPDNILVFLTDYVTIDRFAPTFLEFNGQSCFEVLMKKEKGRDFIARLAYTNPNKIINKFFFNNPPNDLSEREIDLLMHGLPHDCEDINQGYLCIPSLIPLVSSYKLRTPLENYIVGSAVGRFFSPLKAHFKRFLSTYISSTILRYQIVDPEFLPYITDPNYPHFNVIQSTPIETKKPSKFRRPVSFCFWFNVFELKGELTKVISFNDGSLSLDENGYVHIGDDMMFCPPHVWHSVAIITTSDGMVCFYIDKRLMTSYKTNTSEVPFFSFGNAGLNSMIYFISPYLKSSTTVMSTDQIEQFHLNGPNAPTNILIEPTNGLHYVVSDGLPKYLSTVGGPFFVFDVAMMTNTIPQFLNCLEAAFNLLELGFIEKESFISSLRFILRQKSRYEDSVIQLLRDRIMNYFEIHDVCLFLNDFVLLSTKAENLIRMAPLDMSSSNCNSHFFYVIEEFCFFEFNDEIQDNLLDVLKYFIEFDDTYLRNMLVYLYSLPGIDIEEITSVDDFRQYNKQMKLIHTFFDCLNTIPTTLSNDDVVMAMTMLNPTVGSEFFFLLSKRVVENEMYAESQLLTKCDCFLCTIAKYDKTWTSLFSLLTAQFNFNKFKELLSNKEEITIQNSEYIDVIFKLIANSFLRTEYSDNALHLVIDLMKKDEVSILEHFTSFQYLCTLGFTQKRLHHSTSVGDGEMNKIPLSKSLSLSSSMNNLTHKAEKRETDKKSTKLETISIFLADNFSQKKKNKMKIPLHHPAAKLIKHHSTTSTTNFTNSPSNSSLSNYLYSTENLVYEELFDPNLLSNLSSFIKSRKVSENDVLDIPIDIPSPEELGKDRFIKNNTINFIIELIIEILLDHIEDPSIFVSYLINLTLLNKDVDPEIATKFHQHIILRLLKEDKLIDNQDSFNQFIQFLSFRIYEGWWGPDYKLVNGSQESDTESDNESSDDDNHILLIPLFKEVIDLLDKSISSSKFFIFSIFHCASRWNEEDDSALSTLQEEFKSSEYYQTFQSNPDDYIAYLMLTGQNSFNQNSKKIIESFKEQAVKNISNVTKERNNYTPINSFELERLSLYKNQIVVSTNFRKMARYQFFWHLNTSAMYLDKAISNIHLQRLKHRFTYGIPAKFLVSYSSSPLCVPRKLLPRIFSYDNRCQKMAKLIDIPRSYHRPHLQSFLPELNKVFSAPYCFAGWKFPCFVNVHFMEFAKEAFNGLPNLNPFEAQILGTPEACQCVIVLSEKAISIILNCDLQGKTPPTENLCHYPLYEEAMAGYFGTPSIFFGKPAFSIPLTQITMVFPRRYLHSAIALDFFTITGTQVSLIVSSAHRNLLINYLRPKYNKEAKTGPLYAKQLLMKTPQEVAKKWATGNVSSFIYLLYLNYTGNRAFTDYSQYPVFPWIVSDYETSDFPPALRDLSKPLGQITEERREKFESIFNETDHEYFYGTHYSNPAGVLHYMMRAEPFTIFNVVLHTGFDHRDRLFSSLEETWKTCSERNTTDLKELIPQFYCFPSMFKNINKLQLQTRSDGTDINSVHLPPWAPTPQSFVKRHRQILESNLLSKTLPQWIDLIFGYKQRGQPAVEAKNLFLPISYDVPGAKNDFYSSNIRPQNSSANDNNDFDFDDDNLSSSSIGSINNDEVELNDAEIDTILNFGQCPLQVLTTPHIQRTSTKYANIENSISRHVVIRKIKEEELENKSQTTGSLMPHSISSFNVNTNANMSLIKKMIISDVGYDIHDDYSDSLDDEDSSSNNSNSDDDDNENDNKNIELQVSNDVIHSQRHFTNSTILNIESTNSKWRITYNPSTKKLRYTQGLNWPVGGKLNLSVSERRIHFHSQRINSDTLIDIVDAVLSRDQTLLTIITSFGKIDTYSLLYNHLEPISTSFLPDIIPLVAVDVSSHFSMIVVTSKSYIAVVDLGTGFLLSKLHKSFDKVAFDETHEFIIASSSATNEISIFSLNLHLICQAKYSLQTTLRNTENFIIDHQTHSPTSTTTTTTRPAPKAPTPSTLPKAKTPPPAKPTTNKTENTTTSSTTSTTMNNNNSRIADEITCIATTDQNHWETNPYFVTGHRNGAVNVWHVNTTPSPNVLRNFEKEPRSKNNISVTNDCIVTCKTLCMAENTIDSILIFARGRALAYIDHLGNVGIVSICMKNRNGRKILKNSCFENCCSCSQELNKKSSGNTRNINSGASNKIFSISGNTGNNSLNLGMGLKIGSIPTNRQLIQNLKKENPEPNENVSICSICALPCCKNCLQKGNVCLKCQEIIHKHNHNFISDDMGDVDI